MTSVTTSPTTTTAPLQTSDMVVIHELTDVAFDQADDHHPLFEYFRYLDELEERRFESAGREAVNPADRRGGVDGVEPITERAELPPQLVVITGNITPAQPRFEDGWQRQTLRAAANALRARLEGARRPLKQSVFVVPGSLDISWTAREESLAAFTEAFAPFTIPTASAGYSYAHVAPAGAPFEVHLFNTCALPGELLRLPSTISKEFEVAVKEYERTLKEWEKRQRRAARRYDRALDQRLAAAVSRLQRAVPGGRILPGDLDGSGGFAHQFEQAEASGENHRLKVLLTYHPLLGGSEYIWPTQAGAANFDRILQLAREHGFHAAFHGHAQQTQAFATLTSEERQVPLRQIGSASLSGTHTYNEIVATRNPQTQGWRVEMRAIKLPSPDSSVKPIYVVLSPLADVTRPPASRKNEAAQKRQTFEYDLRVTMRQLAEEIESGREEIPFPPMITLQAAIQDVIFDGFDTRVGLVIKTGRSGTNRVELQSKYIEPDGYSDYRFTYPFAYPITPPAWALILGRILVYPRDFGVDPATPTNILSAADIDWLNATDKYGPTKDLLEKHVETVNADHEVSEDVRQRELARAQLLYEKFTSRPAVLNLSDTFQSPENSPPPVDAVIYVPIPRRPQQPDRQSLTELGTLIVEVTRKKGADGNVRRQDEEILTSDREDMLRTVSEVIYLTLSTADKLRRPVGSWPRPWGTS